MLTNKIKERNENEAYSELRKMQMLTQVIHTSEPQTIIDELESTISGDPTSDTVGDLDKLKSFGQKVGGN